MAEITRNGPRHRFTWLWLPLASQSHRDARWSHVKCVSIMLAGCAVAMTFSMGYAVLTRADVIGPLSVEGRTSWSESGTSGSPRLRQGNV